MSENQPGPIYSNPTPGTADTPGIDDAGAPHREAVPFQLSQEPLSPELLATSDRLADAHAAADGSSPFTAPAYEHLGELPASYGTQSVYLVAYDPRQLFAYWDLDPAEAATRDFSLRTCRPDGEIESQVDIRPADAGRYLPVRQPQGTYYVELGSYSRNHTWEVLATSGRVTLPPEGLAGETEPKFATLPFHLSFQRLTELIDGAMGTHEDLTHALARLQHGEKPAMSSLLGALSHLSSDQLHTLEMILGEQFAGGSEAIIRPGAPGQLFRDRLEALTSPGQSSGDLFSRAGAGGSEALTSGGALTAGGSEVLSSAGGFGSSEMLSSAGGFGGSEMLSSLGAGFGSDTLFSGGGFSGGSLLSLLAGMGSETLSSFFAAFAGGSEALSSGMLAAGANSEAWRMAGGGGGPGLSSGDLSSDRAAMFLRAVESNLEVLGSLFSQTLSSPGGAGSSPGGGGSGAGSSESVARKKSLW